MIRTLCNSLYALSIVALVGGTAWSAAGIKAEREHSGGRVGFVLLAALQR